MRVVCGTHPTWKPSWVSSWTSLRARMEARGMSWMSSSSWSIIRDEADDDDEEGATGRPATPRLPAAMHLGFKRVYR